MRLLVVEDDRSLAEALRRGLTQEGHVVDVVLDGAEGLDLAESGVHDAMILDVMLPSLDGMAVAQRLREEGITIPILMLTARDALPDRISGFNAGADDYLTKPFAFEELLARLRAITRRGTAPIVEERLMVEALVLVTLLGLAGSSAISAVLVQHALRPIRAAMQRQRDFVADAAHELRTPLAIMRTVGEVGMAEPSADELQATIAQMLGENQHLTRLVEDLSLLARTDTDTMAIDREPVDLSALVPGMVDEIRPLAEAQDVTLRRDVAGNIWSLGDIVRLRQLLLILLDNALKHTPPGGTVGVRLFAQGDRARLQVADSGPGIDPADLQRIFDRFYRADRARTGEGSGLGLAIGKWIVEAHGGQIQAGNATPHGAVFTVTLPLTRSAVAS